MEESGRLERRGDELLKNVVGLTDAQLQNKRDEAILHEAIGHHVWLHPETQHWDAEPQLYHGFWTCLTCRLRRMLQSEERAGRDLPNEGCTDSVV